MGRGSRRVIFINRFFYPDESATSVLVSDLAFSVANSNLEAHAIAGLSHYKRPMGRLESLEHVYGVTIHRVRTLRNGNGPLILRLVNFVLFYAGATIALLRHVRRGDIVVCLTDPPLGLVPARLATAIRGGRFINWVQDVFPETATALGYTKNIRPVAAVARFVRDWAWRSAAMNVVLGHRMAHLLADRNVAAEKIKIVQNWADETSLEPSPDQSASLRRQWGLAPSDFVVMYSGNLGRVHEVETMMGCIELLHRDKVGDVKFLFVGGGAKTPLVKDFVGSKKIGNCVFADFQDATLLPSSLAVANVHWISLRPDLEGLVVPSKFYAACAIGRPILFVGDPEGEIALEILDGDCGRAFAPREFEELAKYILSLKDNAAELERLGANAKTRAHEVNARMNRIRAWHTILEGQAQFNGGSGELQSLIETPAPQ